MPKSQSPYDRRRRPDNETSQFERAWAIVSRNPQISRRQLAHELGKGPLSHAQYWIERLAAAGLIEVAEPGSAGAIRVLVPLALVDHDPAKKRRRRRK